MISAFNSAISGLNAATVRLNTSANNIANEGSTQTVQNGQVVNQPYVAQKVDQVSLSSGGVQAQVSNVSPASVTTSDGNGGLTQSPNVDLTNQLIEQNTASYDFKANLKVLQVQENIDQSLLDIKT